MGKVTIPATREVKPKPEPKPAKVSAKRKVSMHKAGRTAPPPSKKTAPSAETLYWARKGADRPTARAFSAFKLVVTPQAHGSLVRAFVDAIEANHR